MRIKENIALSESGFMFDPNSGESFSLNSTGKEIMRMLVNGKTVEEIEKVIIDKYDIDSASFNRYMDDFFHSLRRFNLIEFEEDE